LVSKLAWPLLWRGGQLLRQTLPSARPSAAGDRITLFGYTSPWLALSPQRSSQHQQPLPPFSLDPVYMFATFSGSLLKLSRRSCLKGLKIRKDTRGNPTCSH
jgi:hypothetical protein